jgi:DNA-binding IscR family transcriptional regulator
VDPDQPRYLSVGDLADRWGLTNPGVHHRLRKHGLLTSDRRVKGGYVFTREEIEELEGPR